MPRANRNRAEAPSPAPLGLDQFPSDPDGSTATTVVEEQVVEGDRPEVENVAAPESSGDALAATAPVIVIEPNRPWSNWVDIDIFNSELHLLRVGVDEHGRLQLQRLNPPQEGDTTPSVPEVLGALDFRALRELGWMCKYPAPFIRRMDDQELAARVVNSMIEASRNREVSVVANEEMATNITAGWRAILPYREVAQLCFDDLRGMLEAEPEVAHCQVANGGLLLRLVTNRSQPITRKVGDVLEMGLEARSQYGGTIELSLYTRRLSCLNGATSQAREFSWQSRTGGTLDNQRAWLHEGIIDVLSHYDTVVTRCKQMAAVRFTGNPRDVLREHARAVRLPNRYWDALVEAFNEEPGEHSYYDIYNAMTRLATHGSLNERNARRLMESAGQWSEEFDMVRCRLPRPVAERLGAQILGDDEDGTEVEE